MKDRLIEKIKESLNRHIGKSCLLAENIADDLIENGVIVPPCKVGDTLYVAFKELSGKVEEIHIEGIEMCRYDNQPDFVLFVYVAEVTTGKRKGEKIKFAGSCFDRKEVCFSKEEAEQALRKEDVK